VQVESLNGSIVWSEHCIKELEDAAVTDVLHQLLHSVEMNAWSQQILEKAEKASHELEEAERIKAAWQQRGRETQRKSEELKEWEADLQTKEEAISAEQRQLHESETAFRSAQLVAQQDREDFEQNKSAYLEECHVLINDQLARDRADLEAEYNTAFDALEGDHSKLKEQFDAVNEQRDKLASIISDYEKNTSYLVELCRSLKTCHSSVGGRQEQLNQERLKLDFALRDLNHIKFESAGQNKSIKIQKKSGSSLTGLLSSVQALSSATNTTTTTTSEASKIKQSMGVIDDEDCDYIDITISDDGVRSRSGGSSPMKKAQSTQKSLRSKHPQGSSKKEHAIPVVSVDWSTLGSASTPTSRTSQRQQPIQSRPNQKH